MSRSIISTVIRGSFLFTSLSKRLVFLSPSPSRSPLARRCCHPVSEQHQNSILGYTGSCRRMTALSVEWAQHSAERRRSARHIVRSDSSSRMAAKKALFPEKNITQDPATIHPQRRRSARNALPAPEGDIGAAQKRRRGSRTDLTGIPPGTAAQAVPNDIEDLAGPPSVDLLQQASVRSRRTSRGRPSRTETPLSSNPNEKFASPKSEQLSPAVKVEAATPADTYALALAVPALETHPSHAAADPALGIAATEGCSGSPSSGEAAAEALALVKVEQGQHCAPSRASCKEEGGSLTEADSEGRGAAGAAPSAPAAGAAGPLRWQAVLRSIKEMRRAVAAPVDSMGCEKAGQELPDKQRRYSVLVSALLSSQTKDQVTHAAVAKLHQHGLLSPSAMHAAEEASIRDAIYPVGFYSRKAQYLKRVAALCLEDHAGDIPPTLEGLLALPGVGPKMAYLVMNVAWEKVTGICVDTHVHRISQRLGWTDQKVKTPEQTRVSLESWLPVEEWFEINPLLVGFGQTICLPVHPKCGSCQLAQSGLCPSAKVPRLPAPKREGSDAKAARSPAARRTQRGAASETPVVGNQSESRALLPFESFTH